MAEFESFNTLKHEEYVPPAGYKVIYTNYSSAGKLICVILSPISNKPNLGIIRPK